MTDKYGRKIEYLRISVTDACNLRRSYCMPDGCLMPCLHSADKIECVICTATR
ncbi:MAG: hypothetical protein ACI4PB_06790 [Oscillospiraceae bacterium]